MTYVKTNWVTGDIITAEKLNKIEDGIASAGWDVFKQLNDGTLTNIVIPDDITIIGFSNEEAEIYYSPFIAYPVLESIDLNNVTSISNFAFLSCSSLTSVEMPSVTSIGNDAFNSCSSLASVEMPNVTSIGVNAFEGCSSLTSVEMPNVTSIGVNAFFSCSSLTSVEIPNVTSIGNGAFASCSSLTSVTINNTTTPALGIDAFENTAQGLRIYVPASAVDTYKAASGWSDYANKIYPIE